MLTSKEAKKKLIEGNERYLRSVTNPGDVSPAIRNKITEGEIYYLINTPC